MTGWRRAGPAAASGPHPSSEIVVGLYERHASTWDLQRSRGTMERAWLDRFHAALGAEHSVLDLGCGMGEPIAAYLTERRCTVVGVDSSPAMIGLCRQRFPGAEWLTADMRTLQLGRRFGGILAWDSFFHLAPDAQRRMFGVFQKHAQLGAALMFTSGPASGEAIGAWQGEPLYHASLAPEEYRGLLAAHGFTVLEHRSEDPDCGGHTVWLAQARSQVTP